MSCANYNIAVLGDKHVMICIEVFFQGFAHLHCHASTQAIIILVHVSCMQACVSMHAREVP